MCQSICINKEAVCICVFALKVLTSFYISMSFSHYCVFPYIVGHSANSLLLESRVAEIFNL